MFYIHSALPWCFKLKIMKSYFLLLFSGLIGINGVSFQPTIDTNPLLHKWNGPYNGIPPFDLVKIEHFKPALEAAMAEYLQEVERIASSRNGAISR